jgi:hypothetical protein
VAVAIPIPAAITTRQDDLVRRAAPGDGGVVATAVVSALGVKGVVVDEVRRSLAARRALRLNGRGASGGRRRAEAAVPAMERLPCDRAARNRAGSRARRGWRADRGFASAERVASHRGRTAGARRPGGTAHGVVRLAAHAGRADWRAVVNLRGDAAAVATVAVVAVLRQRGRAGTGGQQQSESCGKCGLHAFYSPGADPASPIASIVSALLQRSLNRA